MLHLYRMTTTITPATLTVTISETIELNGTEQGSTNTLDVGSVNELSKRIMTCDADQDREILNLASTVDGVAVIGSTLVYMRLTNLDDNYFAQVIIDGASTNSLSFKLEPGKSFLWGVGDSSLKVNDSAAITGEATFVSLTKVTVRAKEGAVDVELFTAST